MPFFDPFTVARTGDLLAMRGDSTQAGLRIVALDGSSDRILPYRLRAPRFSPDGRLLAGTRRSGLDEAAAAIWLYDFERDALRALSDGGPNLAVGQGDGLAGWLGDGRTLHFSRSTIENGELSYDIFRQGLDATDATPWISGTFQQRDLATDARGTVGVYRVRETGKPSDLWLADLRGGTPITAPLVDGPDDALHPTVSPDGRWFAYASDRTGTYQVFACTLVRDDRRCQQVSTDGGTQPKWLRTGDAILYRRGVSVMRVSVSLAGSELRLGRVAGRTSLERTTRHHRVAHRHRRRADFPRRHT